MRIIGLAYNEEIDFDFRLLKTINLKKKPTNSVKSFLKIHKRYRDSFFIILGGIKTICGIVAVNKTSIFYILWYFSR